jgi:homoserine dehydrogenase
MTPQQQVEIDPVSGFHELSTLVTDERHNQPTHKLPFNLEDNGPGAAQKLRTVRVALAGCGVVGGGLVRLLHESSDAIAGRFGVRFELTRVLVRDVNRERGLPLDSRLYTNDLDEFLAHDAEVVIEAIGGTEPARTIAYSALKRGKKVITANKELVASYGDTLCDLANENETGLDFGAAVGGSAPVISTLRDLIGTTTPRSVRGILNGTSNFVITQLERGVSLEAALSSARERGLAEADCTRDLDGSDAAA